MTPEIVRIHYRRLPNREEVFEQRVVHREAGCVVTLLEHATVDRPIVIAGRTVLEPSAPIVWFTFAGEWHDIGRFHDVSGAPTGLYANILTPVAGIDGGVWHTTDLFLDVWLDPGGGTTLLDASELDHAARSGWIDEQTALRARREAERLLARCARGDWPPAIVDAWPLERARSSGP